MLELLLRIMSCALILNNHVHSINPAKTVASLWKKKVHSSIHTVIWDLGYGTQNGLDLNFNLEGARSSVRILSEWEQKTFQGNLNWITKIFARKSRHTCRKIHLIHFYNSIFSEWTILGTAQQDLWTRWMQVFIQLKNKKKCEKLHLTIFYHIILFICRWQSRSKNQWKHWTSFVPTPQTPEGGQKNVSNLERYVKRL